MTTMAGSRSYDTHPHDNGCHIHPKCLECPLPRCIHDGYVAWFKAGERAGRDAAILAGLQDGVTPLTLAGKHGINKRTVYRIWRAARERSGA